MIVLRYILPDRRNNLYCLRLKRHELTLAVRRDSLNFFQRLVKFCLKTSINISTYFLQFLPRIFV